MGGNFAILLVSVMRILATLALMLLALAGCDRASIVPANEVVDAKDYAAFFLWAGVRPQPALKQAKTLYILAAELPANAPDAWQSRLAAVPKVNGPEIWITYRVETLRWSPAVYSRLRTDVAQWRAAGNSVVGVQVDFDARTRFLPDYAVFLRDLRVRLPADVQISITGLLDWGANGDPDALNTLGATVDDIVLQTYQGRATVPGYQAYLVQLGRMRVPFRIGLVQGGAWSAPPSLARNRYFRGYVVFLVNPETK
jgi:Protein of unknown function (DUF3142)